MALNDDLWAYIANADENGIRLEMVMGTPYWEAMPGTRHQVALQRLERSIDERIAESGNELTTYRNLYIGFPDGSFKRPDLSIFRGDLPETDGPATEIPSAVVEVLSKGSETKDLQIGPPFYLSRGVLDVVVFNPNTLAISHFTKTGTATLISPAEIQLQCGCQVMV